jgi:hypothetical protein
MVGPISSSNDLHARMLAYKNDCGCRVGAVLMTAVFVLSLIWIAVSPARDSFGLVLRLPWIALLLLLSAGVGKFVGLAYARHRYRALSRQLTRVGSALSEEETRHGRNVG